MELIIAGETGKVQMLVLGGGARRGMSIPKFIDTMV